MGKNDSKKPGVMQVSTLSDQQKEIEKLLSGYSQNLLSEDRQLTDDLLNSVLGTDKFVEQVSTPMMRTFQEYVEPQVSASFRKGGLFSSARGNAIQRALGDLQAYLTTSAAEREWASAQTRAAMLERSLYELTQPQKLALGYLGTPTVENITWDRQSGNFFNSPLGGMAMGLGGLAALGPLSGGGLGSMIGRNSAFATLMGGGR
jgi:hypothetical protein